jgi:guanylate kinase
MAKSVEEISHWPEYDYVVVNDDINNTEEKLKTIITAERLRLSQQPGMVEFVRGLNSEFGDR